MPKITQKWKLRIILLALAATVLVTKPDVERYGDNLQIALPVIAAACAITNGQAGDFAIRYVAMFATVHGSKNLLGKAVINQRPRGGLHGMPSGHSATAALGASYLVHGCIANNIWVKGITILTAGYVGGSRVAVGAHDIWQVMIGMLVGWLSDRLFRHTKTPLAWVREKLKRGRDDR